MAFLLGQGRKGRKGKGKQLSVSNSGALGSSASTILGLRAVQFMCGKLQDHVPPCSLRLFL
jgi:hypothetical protein